MSPVVVWPGVAQKQWRCNLILSGKICRSNRGPKAGQLRGIWGGEAPPACGVFFGVPAPKGHRIRNEPNYKWVLCTCLTVTTAANNCKFHFMWAGRLWNTNFNNTNQSQTDLTQDTHTNQTHLLIWMAFHLQLFSGCFRLCFVMYLIRKPSSL